MRQEYSKNYLAKDLTLSRFSRNKMLFLTLFDSNWREISPRGTQTTINMVLTTFIFCPKVLTSVELLIVNVNAYFPI